VTAPKVSLVTGSARGIGLAVARELSARGDEVHVVWRSKPETGAALEREFPGRTWRADVEAREQVKQLVADVLSTSGRLDTLVHAVGQYEAGPLAELEASDFERLLRNNLMSAVHLIDAARPALRANSASVVLFGCAGVETLRARREAAAYTAAKTALCVYMRSLALEEAGHGVRVNMVSPGLIPHEHASEDTHELASSLPLGHGGRVEDVSGAVAWLTSAAAEHVIGQNLDVAGGWML